MVYCTFAPKVSFHAQHGLGYATYSCDWAQVQRESYSWTTQGLSCHIVWHAKTGKHGNEAIEKTIKYVEGPLERGCLFRRRI
jgi:hypothetical protein